MNTSVHVMVKDATLPTQEYVFDQRTTCKVGRGNDCGIRLPNDEFHFIISRHHCLLDIDPPNIQVRDLGSRNGTYLNGVRIGKRAGEDRRNLKMNPDQAGIALHPGDVLRLGDTILQVSEDCSQSPASPKGAEPAVIEQKEERGTHVQDGP